MKIRAVLLCGILSLTSSQTFAFELKELLFQVGDAPAVEDASAAGGVPTVEIAGVKVPLEYSVYESLRLSSATALDYALIKRQAVILKDELENPENNFNPQAMASFLSQITIHINLDLSSNFGPTLYMSADAIVLQIAVNADGKRVFTHLKDPDFVTLSRLAKSVQEKINEREKNQENKQKASQNITERIENLTQELISTEEPETTEFKTQADEDNLRNEEVDRFIVPDHYPTQFNKQK